MTMKFRIASAPVALGEFCNFSRTLLAAMGVLRSLPVSLTRQPIAVDNQFVQAERKVG